MIKTLAKSIREYKLPSILTLIFIMGEVVIEVLIPFFTDRCHAEKSDHELYHILF